jgi:hypothetical protein
MPNYVSLDGEWYPAKEKVSLKNITDEPKKIVKLDGTEEIVQPGDPYIYEGPDRAALFELYKAGVEKFGIDFHHDPELLNRIKQLGFKNVDEYAKSMGYDKKKVQEEFEKKASVVNKYELPKRVKAIETMGGGIDFAGQGQDRPGGFDLPKELK